MPQHAEVVVELESGDGERTVEVIGEGGVFAHMGVERNGIG